MTGRDPGPRARQRKDADAGLTSASGLSDFDARRISDRFGVAYGQVERDHIISHVLAAISRAEIQNELVFIGGTALTRSHLPNLRLSEDIDLIATGRRGRAASDITVAIERGLRRTHGVVSWRPALSETSGAQPAVLIVDDRNRIQIQLLAGEGYPPWPAELTALDQHYSDALSATLRTLTRSAFVAAKTSAWLNRAASRDLYDLWGLATAGAFDSEVTTLFRRFGPTGRLPAPNAFDDLPTPQEWETALGHQCKVRVDPHEAAGLVRHEWDRLQQSA